MIGGDLNSDVIFCCHDSSRPISRAHPACARSTVLTNYGPSPGGTSRRGRMSTQKQNFHSHMVLQVFNNGRQVFNKSNVKGVFSKSKILFL